MLRLQNTINRDLLALHGAAMVVGSVAAVVRWFRAVTVLAAGHGVGH